MEENEVGLDKGQKNAQGCSVECLMGVGTSDGAKDSSTVVMSVVSTEGLSDSHCPLGLALPKQALLTRPTCVGKGT